MGGTRRDLARASDLVGRRIVAYRPQLFRDGRGGWAHDPEIELDNGVILRFVTGETDISEYGVAVLASRPPK